MRELKAIPYKDLRGGNTDVSYVNMPTTDAVIARNARMFRRGEVSRRKGGEKYSSTQYTGASNIQGLHNFKYGSSSKFLVVENGILYTDDGTTRTSIKTGLSTSNYFDFTTYNGYCWITDGANTFLKYDGTTVTNASIAKPVAGSFAAADSGGAGSPDGTYYYLVTFYNSTTLQESQPFTLSDAPTVTVTTNKIDLTGIPVSSDSQVDARRIYRTTDGGAITSAALVGTISDNTTTTYQDNVADASLGAAIDLGLDEAPVFVKTVLHNERLFGFTEDSSIIRFSRLYNTNLKNNASYWPIGNDGIDTQANARDYREYAGRNDGDNITNMIEFYDYLLIFKDNSVWVLEGFDRPDFILRRLEFQQRVGCVGHRAAAIAGNWCYFLDKNGIYRTNGQVIEPVGQPMRAFFDPSSPNTVEKIDFANVADSVAIEYSIAPNSFVKFSVPTSVDSNNSLHLNYDYIRGNWSWDNGFNAQSWGVSEVDSIDTLIYGDDYGFVWSAENIEGDGGLINGTATSGTSTTLADTSQSFTVDEYKGVYVEILSGTGSGQRRLITSNTSDTLTVGTAWLTTPSTDSVYTIGGIDFYYLHAWDDLELPSNLKILRYINPWIESTGNYDVVVFSAYDFKINGATEATVTLTVDSAWDVNDWDSMYWDDAQPNLDTNIIPSSEEHKWSTFGIRHKKAGQPVILKGYSKLEFVKGIET